MGPLLQLSFWLFALFSIVLNVGAFIPLNVGVVSKQKCFIGISDIRHSFQAKKDIVIIGGSLAGLSIALELATSTNDVQVTVLDSTVPAIEQSEVEFGKTNIASMAAAGMLAPMSERLPSGPLLDLCLDSRAMYGSWVEKVEQLAQSSTLGKKYLWNGSEHDVGYRCNGGFLAPAFAGDGVATWAPPVEGGEAIWLDHSQIMEMENSLNPEIVGGWWFPTDASVDARRLTCSLRAACANSGVELCFGDDYRVKGIDQSDKKNIKVLVESGITYEPKKVICFEQSFVTSLLKGIGLNFIETK